MLLNPTASSGPSSASSEDELRGEIGLQFSVKAPELNKLPFFSISLITDGDEFFSSIGVGRCTGTGFRLIGEVARTASWAGLGRTEICCMDVRFSGEARSTAFVSKLLTCVSSAPVNQSFVGEVDIFSGDAFLDFVPVP